MKRKVATSAEEPAAVLTPESMRCFWLTIGDGSQLLCMEDTTTGDIFMRLIDMK